MAVDDILEALAARHVLASTPEPWLDAARGAISPQEAARSVEGQEDPELVERSLQLFRPGDPAVDERRLRRLLDDGFGPARHGWRGPLGIALALAAALVLAVSLSWPGDVGPGSSPPLLASYSLELDQVARSQRAAEPAAPTDLPRFYVHRSFAAKLRPSTAVHTPVRAEVYACEPSGARRLPVMPRVEPNGMVVVDAEVSSMGLDVGTWELLFVVGPAGSLPELVTCDAAGLAGDAGVQVPRSRIDILPRRR